MHCRKEYCTYRYTTGTCCRPTLTAALLRSPTKPLQLRDQSLDMPGDMVTGRDETLAGSWYVVPMLDHRPLRGQITHIATHRDNPEGCRQLLTADAARPVIRHTEPLLAQ
jgi:hypothetical protein